MLPTLTEEQRMEALTRAAEVRSQRAETKRAIKAGELDPLEAMGMPVMQRCFVLGFFKSLPGVGEAKAAKLMDRFGVSPRKRVGGLGHRQREEISAYLKRGAE